MNEMLMTPERSSITHRSGFFGSMIGVALLTACATTPPLDISGVDTGITPAKVIADLEATRNRRVHWGGAIIQSKNLKEATQIEILAYPLDTAGKPNTESDPQARVLILQPGYLETSDYRPGRLLSVVGTVTEVREGSVGEARYTYPLVRADQLHLWPKQTKDRSGTDIHFGIGIIYSK